VLDFSVIFIYFLLNFPNLISAISSIQLVLAVFIEGNEPMAFLVEFRQIKSVKNTPVLCLYKAGIHKRRQTPAT